MASVYRYLTDGGPLPRELSLVGNIQTYGVRAVMGRDVLGRREIERMNLAQSVRTAYNSLAAWLKNEKTRVEWAKENPELSGILIDAEMAAAEAE
jgi:hypothetical protein